MILRKAVAAEFKAGSEGEFTAEWAVFGNVDAAGDRALPGSFAKALEENPTPPVVWTHLWDVPPIGQTLEAVETATGAKATCRLFLKGDESHEVARQVWPGIKSGAIRNYSFAYDLPSDGFEFKTEDGKRVREVSSFYPVYEWGPTLVGVNTATSTLSAKSLATMLGVDAPELKALLDAAGAKEGRRNSAADQEAVQAIHDQAAALGAACADGSSGDAKRQEFLKAVAKHYDERRAGRKAYGDVDTWDVYLLTSMIEDGASYISSSAEPDEVAVMRGVLDVLAGLLRDELQETEAPADGGPMFAGERGKRLAYLLADRPVTLT